MCFNGDCIPSSSLCNQIFDCEDFDDELDCTGGCSILVYRTFRFVKSNETSTSQTNSLLSRKFLIFKAPVSLKKPRYLEVKVSTFFNIYLT